MIPREGLAGWVTAGSSVRRSRRHRSAPGWTDAECAEEARRIQDRHRSWVVMWSAWHRTFTAFSCFAPWPLVLDQPTTDALVSEMIRAELHHSPTRIDGLRAVDL